MKSICLVIAAIAVLFAPSASARGEDVIARAERAFAAQLELTCSTDAEPEWIAKDAVYKYALTNLRVWLRVEGRNAIAAHLCGLSAIATPASVENVRYIPARDRRVVFVHYDLVSADGRDILSSPLAMIEMRGSRIAAFTQLSRSPESLEVLQMGAERGDAQFSTSTNVK